MLCNTTPASWLDVTGLVISLIFVVLFIFGAIVPDRRTGKYGASEFASFFALLVLLVPFIYCACRVFGSV